MKKPPIPPFSHAIICGAVGDVIRASASWGQSEAEGKADDASIMLVTQTVAQLLSILFQRMPTEQEMAQVVGG